MDALFKNLPEIIVAASRSPLGICALTVIALSIISFFFFRNSSNLVKITNFVLLIIGTVFIVIIGTIIHISTAFYPPTPPTSQPTTSFSPDPTPPTSQPTTSFSPDPTPSNVSINSQTIVGTWQATLNGLIVATIYKSR